MVRQVEARSSLPEVLVDDDLRITRNPGRTGLTVISFTGVGASASRGPSSQREEFARVLAQVGADRHTLIYVIDRRRSWMNGTGERITGILRECTAGDEAIVTLGNSMGGFNALWIAGLLPKCFRAIAFSPQFSVHPEHMPPDDRWMNHRSRILVHDVRHAMEHRSPAVDYWVLAGGGMPADDRHVALLQQHGGSALRTVQVRGGGHDLARTLRSAGVLSPLIRLLVGTEPVTLAQVTALLPAGPLPAAPRGPAGAARAAERQERWRRARNAATGGSTADS